jgi:hypothetical protein
MMVVLHAKTVTIRYDRGAASHYCQGEPKTKIFEDNRGCKEFLIRLADILSGTKTICYARALFQTIFIFFFEQAASSQSPLLYGIC